MNNLQYYLLNKHHGKEVLDESYLNDLYKYFEMGSGILGNGIKISDTDFKKVFSIMYDVLRFRLDSSQFSEIVEGFLQLLMHDAKDGKIVDVDWFVNHVWYLSYSFNDGESIPDYTDCIGFIQDRMVREFNIQENLKQKVNRKFSTFLLK